jgi:hypothetical protein
MATLTEIQSLLNDPVLRDKVRAAVVVTSKNVNFESAATENHAERLAWAKSVFSDPNGMAEKVVRYVVAAHSANTLAEIQGLSDAAIQADADACVNLFAI